MKKTIFQALAVVAALTFSATSGFALDGRSAAECKVACGAQEVTLGEGDNADLQMRVPLSKGVIMSYWSDGNSTFSLGGQHKNGDREFATHSLTTTIWWNQCGADPCGDTADPTYGASSASPVAATNWSSL